MNKTTQRLILRNFTVDDITPEYIKALKDPNVVRLTEARHKRWDEKSVRQYVIDSNKKGVSGLIGMFLKDTGIHIGNIRLFNFHDVHRRAELGVMIFDKSEWGKGYATEALEAVLEYAFRDLKLHRICADYYANNKASEKIFQKLGFEIEGIFKDHFFLNGTYIDSVRIAKINNKST